MIDDEKIIDLFFERSEQGIRELDNKYGAVCHNLSYNIVNNRQDAEECVNDAYLGAWNAIPPVRPNPLLSYIVKIVRNISLKLGVPFVVINCICLSFMQIHAIFYFNYINYSGLLIFCCQNVATHLICSTAVVFSILNKLRHS